jgi:hypothetical protein
MLMTVANILLQLLLLYLIFQYVIGPIIVRFTLTAPDRYSLPRLDQAELLASSPQAMEKHNELLALGFIPGDATNIPMVSALFYAHPHGPLAAILIAKAFVAVVFSQECSGSYLSLSNAPVMGAYPPWRRKIGYHLHTCKDVRELFDNFKRIRSTLALPCSVSADPKALVSMMEGFCNEELYYLVARGFYSSHVSNGKRHVTLKGAFQMVWGVSWPTHRLLLFIEARRARTAARREMKTNVSSLAGFIAVFAIGACALKFFFSWSPEMVFIPAEGYSVSVEVTVPPTGFVGEWIPLSASRRSGPWKQVSYKDVPADTPWFPEVPGLEKEVAGNLSWHTDPENATRFGNPYQDDIPEDYSHRRWMKFSKPGIYKIWGHSAIPTPAESNVAVITIQNRKEGVNTSSIDPNGRTH